MKSRTLGCAAFMAALLSVGGLPLMAESYIATYEAADALIGVIGVDAQTDALQSMMREAGQTARNGRVKVHFGAGQYTINDYLPIYSNMSIVLDDSATVSSVSESAPGMLTAHHFDEGGLLCPRDETCAHAGYSQITNVTICGGTWDRNTNPECDTYIARLVHGADIVISNVTFKSASDHFLNLSGTSNVVLRSVRFLDAVRYQGTESSFWGKFEYGDETRYTTIEAVHLDYCSLEGEPNAYPIDETASRGILIDGCSFSGVFAGVGTHHNPLGDKALGVTIRNSQFEDCLSYACYAFGFSNLEIRNCEVHGGEGLVYASRSDLTAEGNVVDSASESAAYVYDTSNGLFRNNAFSNSSSTVLRANGGSCLVALTNTINVAGRHGVSVSGGRIVLYGNSINGANENGVYVDGATAEICGNEIATPGMAGIRADNGTVLIARGNTISSPGTYGVSVGGGTSFSISDNVISKSKANGIRVEKGADKGLVSGNGIESAGERGIYLLDVKGARIENNMIKNSTGHGLSVQGGSVVATGNTIDKTGKDANGVFLKQTSATISTNAIANVGASGIRADDGTALVARGNVVTNPKAHGLSIGGLSSYNLDGNTVVNAGKAGIFVSACKSGGAVSNNKISSSGESGISVSQSESPVVSGNKVETTGGYSEGIYVREVEKATIKNNTVSMTGGHAIRVQGTAAKKMTATISGNTAKTSGSNYADIRVGDYCLNCVLTGNVTYEKGITVSKNGTSGTTCTPPRYKIVLYQNSATNDTKSASLTCDVGVKKALTKNAALKFAKKGYTFAGWAKSATATKAVYADGQSVSLGTKHGQTVKLYAMWTANAYKVKFDGNGATGGSMKSVAMTYGAATALPANGFKRANHYFKGWSKTKGGLIAYADRQSVKNLSTKAGATVTLYAVWELCTYKVKFDGNGATSGSMKAQSINAGAKKALTANAFKRTGYAFQGWAKKKTATKADYKDKASVKDLATKDGATVTLYAVWKANSYTVKFNANGGTGKMANLAMTYGKAKALTANAFKRTNFTFLGWSTSKTATKATYANKASVKNLKASGTVTLYAVWKRNAYSIVFNANGGTGTMKAQTANTAASVALSANVFKRAGFEFLGWATSPNATKATYSNKAKVKDLAKANKGVTLYAVWSLPAWAKGEFNGWGSYWSPSRNAWFDGIPKVTVSSLGKLSGTFTLEAPGGGTDTVKFSASAFSKYYSGRSMDQVLDLLDPGEDDDPYGIVEDAENGFVPAKIAVYVYKGVSFKMPDGTARKADVVLLSRLYDGKILCGFCCLSLASGMDMGLHQNLFASKHVTLPQFDGTPKKSFKVTSDLREDEGFPSDLTKVEVSFGANGKLTAVGYKGTSKKWTTSATLRVCGYDGSVFGAATDFMTPDGTQLWFDCDLKPGNNGKVSASGITFDW